MKPMNFDFFASGTPEVESATAGLMPYRTVSGASPFECIFVVALLCLAYVAYA